MTGREGKWILPKFSEKSPAYIEGGIEIRCPGKFKKLFLVLKQEHMPESGMLMEIACADCAKLARANGSPNIKRYLHYYNSSGECITDRITSF